MWLVPVVWCNLPKMRGLGARADLVKYSVNDNRGLSPFFFLNWISRPGEV